MTKRMEKLGRISKATFLASLIIMAVLMACVQVASAAVVEVETHLFVVVAPNPVGVKQSVYITVQLDKTSPTAIGVYGGDHFKGFMIKITKPDKSVDTLGPYEAWAPSCFFAVYTPTIEGQYIIQASFPGQWINTSGVVGSAEWKPYTQYYFKPSVSNPVTLNVQREPVGPQGFVSPPLPSDYWERPIYSENKGWWQVADNWLMMQYDVQPRFAFAGVTAFAPYTSAPNSPHILWTRQLWFGGIGGGRFGDKDFYTGLSYEQPFTPIIISGRIYYTEHDPADETNIIGTRCLDLYTGEQIWFLEGVSITFGQIFDIENPNEHGLIAHLWGVSGPSTNTTAKVYDAFTGEYQFTITNITWGYTTFGPSGEILSYSIVGSGAGRKLVLWNSSKAIFESFPWLGGEVGNIYDPKKGAVVDGKKGIQWMVPVPTNVPAGTSVATVNYKEGYLLATYGPDTSTYPFVYSLSMFNAKNGQLLWTRNVTSESQYFVRYPHNIMDGRFVFYEDSTTKLYCFSAETGDLLWVSDPVISLIHEGPVGYVFFDRYCIHQAYGKVYMTGYSGHVYAFDAKSGKLAWSFYFGNSGTETAYGSWPVYNGFTIADHKIYVSNDEHSPDAVLWRGARLWCLDADTGTLLWNISGMLRLPAISDGYLVSYNSYDGQIYVFGKGPSKTTIEAPSVAVSLGSTIVIKGEVLDESPGQPNTPCVAKDSMSAWMEYLHMQKPIPAKVKGVPVDLYAIYPDGTYNYIGTAETNPLAGGVYGFAWKPPMEGTYTIIAVFKGDESYGSSSAGTVIHVTATTPEAEAAQTAVENLKPITTALTAIVIVCIILVAYDIYINRKMLKQTAK